MIIDSSTISLVVSAATVDAINPGAIGVLILIISVILGNGRPNKHLLALGAAYLFGIFAVYLGAGLGLTLIFSTLPLIFLEYLSIIVGIIVISLGLVEVKDYFWYGRGWSLHLSRHAAKKIQQYSSSKSSILGAASLGAIIALIELFYTGAPYVATIALLRINFNLDSLALLLLYNLIFILPMFVILLVVSSGVRLGSVQKWKEDQKSILRLIIGITLITLGWLLILTASGVINFG